MTSTKLSADEKKDVDRYTKFLALKMTQVIVQSRLGEKACTPCKSASGGADWFGLAVPDLPDIAQEARRLICPETGRTRFPLYVDVSLRTAEGETLALESWSLSSADTPLEPAVHHSTTLYNRMGKLLKSLLCVTRAAPAYRLSRRQCPQTYALCYGVSSGQPRIEPDLGEDSKRVRIGQLSLPTSILQMTVAFRTRMTIAPARDPLLVHSRHFNADPPRRRSRPVDLDKPMLAGAFVDESRAFRYTEEDFILPEEPILGWVLGGDTNTEMAEESDESTTRDEETGIITDEKTAPTKIEAEEDRLIPELHFPFATVEKCPTGKLERFYRSCYNAPPLQSLSQEIEEPEDITQQLEAFESELQEYDLMISSLCQSPTANNN